MVIVHMVTVVCINCLMALCVFKMAFSLWQWRSRLALIAQQLEHEADDLSMLTHQMRYQLAHRRVQIVQTQLNWMRQISIWQRRSQQIKQTKRLIRLLQLVLLSRRTR